MIDRITRAHAPAPATSTMNDNKEGMLGLRVIRALEDPNEKSGEFTDATGAVTRMRDMDTTGVTGMYLSSEGKEGGEVWGTRGTWTKLTGTVDGKPVTIAILDHPKNPGYPDLLARARLRAVRRQPARPEGVQRGQGDAGLLDSAPARVPPFRYRMLLLDADPDGRADGDVLQGVDGRFVTPRVEIT